MISFSCMVKKRALSKLEKLSRKPLFIFLLIILFAGIFVFFFTKRQGYTNIVYNYKFEYPRTSKINFISFLKSSTNISTADTISVNLTPNQSVRIQSLEKPDKALSDATVIDSIQLGRNKFDYVKAQASCNYLISNEKVYLCLLINPNLDVEQLLKDKALVNLLKSIEFF